MKKLSLFFALLIINSNCTENPSSSEVESHFSIHLLKDANLTIEHIRDKDVSEIALDPTPWISSDDIHFYDFSTHCIYLKRNKNEYIPGLNSNFELPESWWLKPFVITVSDKAVYMGCFYPSTFVKAPEGVYITDEFTEDYADDIFHISNAEYRGCYDDVMSNKIDVRNNFQVKNALIEDNIFSAGLELTLDTLEIVEHRFTSTVKFTFTITNNDDENLYVIDSDLTGLELFRTINRGGVVLWNEQTSYSSVSNANSNPLENWESSWFTKIGSKQSITRTVSYGGYPPIASGQYYCCWAFRGPLNIEKDERERSDGRYWSGIISASPIIVNL
ncbi:hypothetical protein JW960_00110 [candidate division KSB1 bacterium]|nr:hypothetical protein [candidate division KSB1 bacterium]